MENGAVGVGVPLRTLPSMPAMQRFVRCGGWVWVRAGERSGSGKITAHCPAPFSGLAAPLQF